MSTNPSKTNVVDAWSPVPLTGFTAAKHPLSDRRYTRLYDELNEMAEKFANLNHDGIAREVESARVALSKAWDMVQLTERAERAAMAGS